jgi:hypothetical protein
MDLKICTDICTQINVHVKHRKVVLIVTGTVTDVPQTFSHLVSGVIIVKIIDNRK